MEKRNFEYLEMIEKGLEGKCDLCSEKGISFIRTGGLVFRACDEHRKNTIWIERSKNIRLEKQMGYRMLMSKYYQCPVCWKKFKKNGVSFKKHIHSHAKDEIKLWIGEGSEIEKFFAEFYTEK